MTNWKIPISRPEITRADRRAVDRVLKSGNLANGPLADIFAQEFARKHGFEHGVAVSNGTVALEILYKWFFDYDYTDFCLPKFTFCATRNAANRLIGTEYLELEPEVETWDGFVRIHNGQFDGDRSTTTTVVVNAFGFHHGTDMPDIVDACESVGAVNIGKISDEGQYHVFSFFPNKQITTCEGAVICWNGGDVSGIFRDYRSHGNSEATNARMSEVHAALGLSQLERLNDKIKRRFAAAERYTELLKDQNFFLLPYWNKDGVDSPFSFFILCHEAHHRLLFDYVLETAGVQTRQYFKSDEPRMDNTPSRQIFRRILHLPFYDTIPVSHIDEVCRLIMATAERLNEPQPFW